jgi:putative endonuclease
MHERTQRGRHAELQVAQTLQKQGFTILAYNYRIKGAEIDLIATKDSLLIFVEVKMRTQNYFDLGDVIVASKKRKIMFAAKDFIARNKYHQISYRFDVALIQETQMTYIPNAFNEGECTW